MSVKGLATFPEIPNYPTPDPGVILPAAKADGFAAIGDGRTLDADVVIVGSGPGGAAAAWTLAAGGLRVVVLEEGPAKSRFRPNQGHTSRFHMQEGGSMVTRGEVMFPIAAGRGVGGGTLINSALSFRTPRAVLSHWTEILQDDRWGVETFGAVLDEVSEMVGVGITPDHVAGENNRLIVRGIDAMGHDGGLAPRSTPGCAGCGVCNYGCPSNGKASTNLTFLPRAVADGAVIQAECKALEVLIEDGRAAGVRGVGINPDTGETGGSVTVRAPKVILSAGAIGTPRLLWHSGLAPRLGPTVGQGLHVHPGSAVLGLADQDIHLWRGASQGAFFHHAELPGILPHTFTAPPEVCLLAMRGFAGGLEQALEWLPRLTGLIVLVSDKDSIGTVNATTDGRADINFKVGEGDFARTKAGLIASAEVLWAGGARTLFAPIHGVPMCKSVDEFADAISDRLITDLTMYSAHPMGTCTLGLDPATSVINPRGQAHQLPGLYIADASVYPSSIGVNPQLTTMATGTTIARAILDEA